MIYCLKSFSQVQICHLLTSLSLPSPCVVHMNAGPTDNDGAGIERRVTLPFPSLYDSLTRFPLSSVPHVSRRCLLRILRPHPCPSAAALYSSSLPNRQITVESIKFSLNMLIAFSSRFSQTCCHRIPYCLIDPLIYKILD